MARLYLKLLALGTVIFMVMYLITGYMDRMAIQKFRMEKPFWVMNQRGRTFDFAVIGSSRAENCTDVATIEKVTGKKGVNLGVQGACFADNLIMFRRFLNNGNKAKLLLIEVDEYALDARNSFLDPFKVQFYLPYLDDPWVQQVVADNVSGSHFYLWRYLPVTKYIEYNTMYLTYLFQHWLGRMAFDYEKTAGTRLEPTTVHFVFDLEKVQKNKKKGKSIDAKDLAYVNRLITHALNNGIKVMLYTAPQYHEQLAYLPNRADFLSNIAGLSRFYGVAYHNYESDELTRDRAMFVDASHLNAKGTVLFSGKLADEVRKTF